MREDQNSLDAKGINEEVDDSAENTNSLDKKPFSAIYNTLTPLKWNEKSLDKLQGEITELFNQFDDFFRPREAVLKEMSNLSSSVGKWPPIDLREDADHYYIDISISGFNKDDLDIALKDDAIIISACKRSHQMAEGERTLHSEIRYRSGKRIIPLASFKNKINKDNITAKTTDNNIITIVLPKQIITKAEQEGRKIEIQ